MAIISTTRNEVKESKTIVIMGRRSNMLFAKLTFLVVVVTSGFHRNVVVSGFQQCGKPLRTNIPSRAASSVVVGKFEKNYQLGRFEKSDVSLGVVGVGKEQEVVVMATTITSSKVVAPSHDGQEQVVVPTDMADAIRIFFFSRDYGPLFVVLSIGFFCQWRMNLLPSLAHPPIQAYLDDAVVFAASIVFWWIQEHVLHQKVLHSTHDWKGKKIHQGHHDKPYYHISIDPAPLLLGWMWMAHVVLRLSPLPLPLALSATLGYSVAGLFYEWAHYIVHTKVRFQRGSF
jgi:hypothetical protein